MSSSILQTHGLPLALHHSGHGHIKSQTLSVAKCDRPRRPWEQGRCGQRGECCLAGAALGAVSFFRDDDDDEAQPQDMTSTDAESHSVPVAKAHKPRRRHKMEEALPISLFAPYEDLPQEGRVQTARDATCDPMEQNCQVPMFVWESECLACCGTGFSSRYSSRRSGRRTTASCTRCQGIGVVRMTSARILPDINNGGRQYTLGRPVDPNTLPKKKGSRTLLERLKEKLRRKY